MVGPRPRQDDARRRAAVPPWHGRAAEGSDGAADPGVETDRRDAAGAPQEDPCGGRRPDLHGGARQPVGSEEPRRPGAQTGVSGGEVGEWPTFHTFRHTCATQLFRTGWNAAQVSRFLGHSDAGFTLRTYVHLLDEDLPEPDVLASIEKSAAKSGGDDREANTTPLTARKTRADPARTPGGGTPSRWERSHRARSHGRSSP
jgi:hypothetical protein